MTGGGQDFVRVYAEKVYGIPPQQVVGTAGGTKYGYGKDGKPFLTKEPKLILNDNNAGKPEGIHLMIGRRPYAASATRRATARCWNGPARVVGEASGRAVGVFAVPRRRAAPASSAARRQPTDVIDIRHLPRETQHDTDAMIARLTGQAPSPQAPPPPTPPAEPPGRS